MNGIPGGMDGAPRATGVARGSPSLRGRTRPIGPVVSGSSVDEVRVEVVRRIAGVGIQERRPGAEPKKPELRCDRTGDAGVVDEGDEAKAAAAARL